MDYAKGQRTQAILYSAVRTMNLENSIPPWEKPFLKAFENWSEQALSFTLIGIAIFCIWIALKKDHAVMKAVLITWILLP